jgi:hypothetical protein
MRHLIGSALCLLAATSMTNAVWAGPGGYATPASSYGGSGAYSGSSGGYYGGAPYSTYYGAPVYSSWGTGGLVYPSWNATTTYSSLSSPSYSAAYSSGYRSYGPSTTYTPTYGYPYTSASYYNGHAYGWPLPTSMYSYSSNPR